MVINLTDYDFAKKRLILKLVSEKEMDSDGIVYRRYEDMLLVPYVLLGKTEDGIISVVVTKALFDRYGITVEQLFKDCFENAEKINPVKMGPMFFGMYLVTNKDQLNGACTLFYPGVMEKVADDMNGSYYALPSSKHEFIIMPDDCFADADVFASIVRDVNASGSVGPDDKLTDHVYRYDASSKTFTTVA